MTQDEIIAMAREAGLAYGSDENPLQSVVRFAALVAAEKQKEIDRLKALCEEMLSELYVYRASEYLKDTTAAIKARGLKK